MTRKDYIAVAARLKADKASDAEINRWADIFEDDNPRFDRPRFIAACAWEA
jgi:hypothetical protein